MDEKVSATTVLGTYAEACPSGFMPFMEPSLSTLSTMVEYWHDEARAAAYDSLHKLVLAAHTSFPPTQRHSVSNGSVSVTEPVELSPQARHVLGVVLPLLTSPAEYDTSKVAVAAAAAALGHLLKALGRGAVEAEQLLATSKMATALLHGRAICQVGGVCFRGFGGGGCVCTKRYALRACKQHASKRELASVLCVKRVGRRLACRLEEERCQGVG